MPEYIQTLHELCELFDYPLTNCTCENQEIYDLVKDSEFTFCDEKTKIETYYVYNIGFNLTYAILINPMMVDSIAYVKLNPIL